jgi:cell division protein FtsL
MNTIVRAEMPSGIRDHEKEGTKSPLSKRMFWLFTLGSAIFFSALGVVYIKDINRRLFVEYQRLQQEKDQELIRLEQLLLEHSRWSTQPYLGSAGRIKLGLHIPTPKEVVLVAREGSVVAKR